MNILNPVNPASPLNPLHSSSPLHDTVSSGSAMVVTVDMTDIKAFFCSALIYILLFAVGFAIGHWSSKQKD